MILLFLHLGNFSLFLLKILSGIIMVLITFGYKNIKYLFNNFINLVVLSVILGGSLYLFNLNSNINNISFFNDNKFVNILVLLVISIITLFIYIKNNKHYHLEFDNHYEVYLYIDSKKLKFNAYLDTGNKLKDPYFNKPIILIYSDIEFKNIFYVPYKSLNNSGILECMTVDKIYIKNIGYKYDVIVGKSIDKFGIEGIDMILNEYILK